MESCKKFQRCGQPKWRGKGSYIQERTGEGRVWKPNAKLWIIHMNPEKVVHLIQVEMMTEEEVEMMEAWLNPGIH